MAVDKLTYKFLLVMALIAMVATGTTAQTLRQKTSNTAQEMDTVGTTHTKVMMPTREVLDSTYMKISATNYNQLDSVAAPDAAVQSGARKIRPRKPDPETATWLALAIPGGGQIYNRKFWKLPIVYGGFVGCLYAYNWNGQMYKDYRQAYLDIMDSDPNTNSYKDFFRPGYDYEANREYLKDVFKKRKDRYRRWRDLSIFSFIGVYALSVIDAYVDAQLANFDISEDIHLSIEPQIIDNRQMFGNDYYGFNCNIRF